MHGKKLGFFRKYTQSNKRLIEFFEKNQKLRSSNKWEDKNFVKKLLQEEKKARREILAMLRQGKLRTSDDFYRAAYFFHHSNNFRSYALAVALAAASYHLGEPWGKNLYAVALDRFLLSTKQPQYFGTQIVRRKGKWALAPYNKKATDEERKMYFVDTLEKTLKVIEKMNISK